MLVCIFWWLWRWVKVFAREWRSETLEYGRVVCIGKVRVSQGVGADDEKVVVVMEKTMEKPVVEQEFLKVPAMDLRDIQVTLVGTTPLIVHAWSEKAKRLMLDAQQKKGRQKKEAKSPESDFKDSLYYVKRDPDVYGFPVIAFKAATADTWAHLEGLKKGIIRGSYHIINGIPTNQGDLVELKYDGLRMREDMVRIGMGVADLRYRGEFSNWSVKLLCRYNARVMSAEQLLTVFDAAGFAIGVGEWRSARDGSFGMFRVESVQ